MNDTTAGVRGEALPPAGEGRLPAGSGPGPAAAWARGGAPLLSHPLLNMSLAMLLVGATAPLGELALSGLPLFPLLALRLLLAGAVLLLASARAPGVRPPHAGRRDGAECAGQVVRPAHASRLRLRHWAVLTLQAGCGVLVFNAGMWLGMRESGPAAAGVFTSVTPAVMALIGVAAFGERLGGRAVMGVALACAGVMAARGAWSGGWDPGLGDLLLACAVAGESVFLLALKWLPQWLSPMDAARRIVWIGFLMVLPLALWQGRGLDLAGVSAPAWAAVAALGVLVTAGGYVLWFRGVARATSGQAAAVTGLLPVSAVLASWLLLGQAPDAGQAAGCLAVGAGIWLASAGR